MLTEIPYPPANNPEFAKGFERSDDIKLYAKLPGWFKVDTPLGTYNPDWAVLIEINGQEKLTLLLRQKVHSLLMHYVQLKS